MQQVVADIHWETDMETALQKAAVQGKGIVIEFSGSDWCEPSQLLRKKVLHTKEFEEELKDEFIFVNLDFPTHKLLPEKLRDQNEIMSDKYGIESFPTLIFTDTLGRPYHSFTGLCDWETAVIDIGNAKSTRDEFLVEMSRMNKAVGDERFRLMGQVANLLPDELLTSYYSYLVDEANSKDVEDLSGLKQRLIRNEEEERIARYMSSMNTRLRNSPFNALQEIEEYALRGGLSLKGQQLVMFRTAHILVDMGKPDEAVERIEKAIGLYPSGEQVELMRDVQRSIKRHREEILKKSKTVIQDY